MPDALPVPDPTDPSVDPLGLLDLMEKAVTTRNYSMGAGVLLLICVYLVRLKWKSLPADLLPAVTLALASVPALALTLMKPDVSLAAIWKEVFMISLMAGGAWSAIGKRIFEVWAPAYTNWVRSKVLKGPPPPTSDTDPTPP